MMLEPTALATMGAAIFGASVLSGIFGMAGGLILLGVLLLYVDVVPGMVLFGAIQAILFVVVLALLRFVRLTARPKVEILGELAGNAGYQSIERHPAAASPPWKTATISRARRILVSIAGPLIAAAISSGASGVASA